MSTAKPMTHERRAAIYLRDRVDLTPRQTRRLRTKVAAATSDRVTHGLPRTARLRRRFDRKDQRRVAAAGAQIVGLIRAMRAGVR